MGEKTTITIEPMKKEDIDQVLAIEQASFAQPWSRNLFLSEFRNAAVSSLLVALAGDREERRVVGYIICWKVEDELHILNLAVALECRRCEIGKHLVLTAVKGACKKGAKRAFLEVRASNIAAQKLYSRLGFTGTAVRRNYYDAPMEDAIIMVLDQGEFQSIACR